MADNSAASPEEAVKADTALVDFGTVVAGKERFDVCRLFLASLQLVRERSLIADA